MIGSILMIIFGIPYGVILHRDKPKLAVPYTFIFIAILAICSLVNYAGVVTAMESINIVDYYIGLFQLIFGAGIGVCLSWVAKRIHHSGKDLT